MGPAPARCRPAQRPPPADHQPARRAPQQPRPRQEDVRGDRESDDRIKRSHPVIATSGTPATTPTDVHTSVSRWVPSASSVTDRCSRPARTRTNPTPRLISDAQPATAKPMPTSDSGCGSSRRSVALTAIVIAASRIKAPSNPADRCSAFAHTRVPARGCSRRRSHRLELSRPSHHRHARQAVARERGRRR